MKRIAILALAAAIATPAAAQVTETESTAFTGNRAVLCNLDGVDALVDFGALGNKGAAAAQVDNQIDLFCNQPFTASLVSQNGYLRLNASNPANLGTETNPESGANPGFAAGLDYQATLISGSFSVTGDSSQITAATPTQLGGVLPAQNVNNAKIRYDTIPGSLPLLGGTYQDTLTITLTTQGV